MICGTVKRFLLFGDHDGDVFATGGEMEIVQVSKTHVYYMTTCSSVSGPGEQNPVL